MNKESVRLNRAVFISSGLRWLSAWWSLHPLGALGFDSGVSIGTRASLTIESS